MRFLRHQVASGAKAPVRLGLAGGMALVLCLGLLAGWRFPRRALALCAQADNNWLQARKDAQSTGASTCAEGFNVEKLGQTWSATLDGGLVGAPVGMQYTDGNYYIWALTTAGSIYRINAGTGAILQQRTGLGAMSFAGPALLPANGITTGGGCAGTSHLIVADTSGNVKSLDPFNLTTNNWTFTLAGGKPWGQSPPIVFNNGTNWLVAYGSVPTNGVQGEVKFINACTGATGGSTNTLDTHHGIVGTLAADSYTNASKIFAPAQNASAPTSAKRYFLDADNAGTFGSSTFSNNGSFGGVYAADLNQYYETHSNRAAAYVGTIAAAGTFGSGGNQVLITSLSGTSIGLSLQTPPAYYQGILYFTNFTSSGGAPNFLVGQETGLGVLTLAGSKTADDYKSSQSTGWPVLGVDTTNAKKFVFYGNAATTGSGRQLIGMDVTNPAAITDNLGKNLLDPDLGGSQPRGNPMIMEAPINGSGTPVGHVFVGTTNNRLLAFATDIVPPSIVDNGTTTPTIFSNSVTIKITASDLNRGNNLIKVPQAGFGAGNGLVEFDIIDLATSLSVSRVVSGATPAGVTIAATDSLFDELDEGVTITLNLGTFTLADGSYSMSIYVRDIANNVQISGSAQYPPYSVSFIVDRTDPVITSVNLTAGTNTYVATAPEPNPPCDQTPCIFYSQVGNGSFSVQVTAQDVLSGLSTITHLPLQTGFTTTGSGKLDFTTYPYPTTPQTFTESFNFTSSTSFDGSFTVTAKDYILNDTTDLFKVRLDNKAPRITGSVRNGGGGTSMDTSILSSEITANWDAWVDDRVTVSDAVGSGVSFVEMAVGVTTSCAEAGAVAYTSVGSATSHTFTGLSLADGVYYVKVRATDRVNNVSTCSVGPALTLDTTAPQLLEFVIADPFPTKAGSHLIQLSFSETMSTSVAVSVDVGFGAPPPNNFTVTPSGGTNGWQVSGGKQVWMGVITIADNVLATDGLNSFKFSLAQDVAGNVMVVNTQTGVIDTVDPAVSNVQLNGGAAFATSRTLTLTFNGADVTPPTAPASGVLQYFWSFNAPTPDTASTTDKTLIAQNGASVTLNIIVPTDGTHTVYVWAEDNANNVGAALSDSILVDTGLPTVTQVNITTTNGSTNTAGQPLATTETVTVTIDFSEAMNQLVNPGVVFGLVDPFSSGGALNNNPGWLSATQWQGQFLVTAGSENGLHTLRITGAQDLAGNAIATTDTNAAPLLDQFEIDTLAPVVSNVLNEGGATFTTQPQINFTFDATDGAGSGIVNHYYELDVNNGGVSPVPGSATADAAGSPGLLPAGDGQHTVYVWAIDRAGNVGVAASDDIRVDLISPTVQAAVVDNPPKNALQPGTGVKYLGPGTLELTVTFSEAMNPTINPTAQLRDPNGAQLAVFFTPVGFIAGTGDLQWRGTLLTSLLPQDGQFTVDITGAQDPAGNLIAPAQTTFVVDTTPPSFTSVRFLTPQGLALLLDPATNTLTYSGTTEVAGDLLRILDLEVNTDADGAGVGQQTLHYRVDYQFGLNDPLEIGPNQSQAATTGQTLLDELVRIAEDANQVMVSVWAEDLLGNVGSPTAPDPYSAVAQARIDTEPQVEKPTPQNIADNPVFQQNPQLVQAVNDSVTAVAAPGLNNVLQNDLLVSDLAQADYETFAQVQLAAQGPAFAVINTEAAGGPGQDSVTLLSLAGEPGEVLYDIRPLSTNDGGLTYASGAPLSGAAYQIAPDAALLQQNIITTQWSLSAIPEGLYQVDQRFFDLPARNETSASVLVLVDKTPPLTSALPAQQPGAPHIADLAATMANVFEPNVKGAAVPYVYVRQNFFDWQGRLDDRTQNPNVPRGRVVRFEYQFASATTPTEENWRDNLTVLATARAASAPDCGWRTAIPAATVDYCLRGDASTLPNGGGDGLYYLFLRMTDSAGNSSVSSTSFVLDNVPPDIIPDNLRDGQIITFRDDDVDGSLVEGDGWNRLLSGSWTIDDDLARITLFLCPQTTVQGDYAACLQTLATTLYDVPGKKFRANEVTVLPVGLYSAFYEAEDLAGNLFTRRLDFKVSNKVSVDLQKSASVSEAETGDVVQYQVALSLLSQSEGDSLTEFYLLDTPAPVLKYLPGSARLLYGGQTLQMPDPAFDNPALPGKTLRFEISPTAVNAVNPGAAGYKGLDITSSLTVGDTTPNKLVLTYYMVVGATRPGDQRYTNTVTYRPRDPTRQEFVTATADVKIRGREGVFRSTGIVLGKVYHDGNQNGVQDRGERGVAGVRLYTENGIAIDTGLDGKYSVSGLNPGKHVLKLFPPSLPRGLRHRDGLSKLFDVPRGGLTLVDFGLVE